MKKKRICLDLSTIIPGKGGSGGGVATYGFELIKHLDALPHPEIDFFCLLNSEVKLTTTFKRLNIEYVTFDPSSFFSRMRWLHISLPKYCKKNNIDLLYRATPDMPISKPCLFSCTVHDFMPEYYLENASVRKHLLFSELLKHRFFSFFAKLAIKKCDIIITPSEAIRQELLARTKKKLDPGLVKVTHEASSISVKNFDAVNQPQEGKIRFGVIAGFYPHKGQLRVIEFAKELIKNGFTNFSIYFRGNPTYKTYMEEVKDLVEKENLTDFVTFVPFQKEATILDIYSSIDILLLLSEYEGFGLPLLEAQAMGKPIICSDIPVFREILNNSAFYAPLPISKSQVTEIIHIINAPETLNSKVLLGFENIKLFSWQKTATDTLAIFRSIVSQS